MHKTTEGWNLLVSWKGENQQWVPLKIMKQSNPIEVAEFACSHEIDASLPCNGGCLIH